MNKMTCLNDNLIKVIGANEKINTGRYDMLQRKFGLVYISSISLHLPYDIDQPLIQVESDPRNKSVPILEPF